jgi:hypothetical protein
MFRPLKCSHRTPHRRGTSFILIVVVMLSLFSAVGTAYALFAMREAKLALQRKQEQGGGTSAQLKAPDPTETVNQFFSALIYDKGNDQFADLTNGMRGHSIGRSMYGCEMNQFNTAPWGGIGTFREDLTTSGFPGVDRSKCVNYTVMTLNGQMFLLDPEYTGRRTPTGTGTPNTFNPADVTNPRTYIGKNAGYSYPDLKDFFLGYRDAASGEVLVPSFHRPWLFGSLEPANVNWTNDQGKLLTLRPRPAEHPQFPRVPPYTDALGNVTYPGDVKNFPGAPGGNDSIWINLGLRPIPLPNNRKVQPLVAVLVLPLNGCLDVNSVGNTLNGGNAHTSNQGIGQWEVNPTPVFPTDAASVVKGRDPQWKSSSPTAQPPQQRMYAGIIPAPTGPPTRSFDPFSPISSPLPNYASVAWDGTLITVPPAYPNGASSLSGVPDFATSGFQSTNTAAAGHPSLHNPSEWPGTKQLGRRTYPLSDIKRFHLRYAPTPDWLSQADLTANAPSLLAGQTNPYGFTLVTKQQTPSAYAYRLDPAHTRPGLVTTRSYGLDRPKLTPSFVAGSLQLTVNPADTFYSKPTPATLGAYPSLPLTPGPGSDFTSASQWSNKYAALGAIDLNRPLADYRGATTNQPLSNATVTAATMAQADSDRQQLARDIFIRLAVSTGAAIDVTITGGNVTYQFAPSATSTPTITPQFAALRYLAQLAVNMVDYIDNDDISTRFAWHPTDANQVVFGVEKPRLVINEVYSEVTNNPADKTVDEPVAGMKLPLTNAQAHVRFWLELLNPSSTPATANGPLGTGGVPVNAYRVEIARVQGAPPPTPYWRDPSNTTGEYNSNPATKADIVYQFTQGVTVEPNYNAGAAGAAYNPAGDRTKGIFLIGPELDQTKIKTVPNTTPPTPYEFNPEASKANPPWSNAAFVPYAVPMAGMANANMLYTTPMPAAANLATDFKRHIVLLRRLANPYVAEGPNNPYITVDMMDHVPSFDGVARADGDRDARTPRGAGANPQQFDPIAERFAMGKVQPYAGYSTIDTAPNPSPYNAYNFNGMTPASSSMVLAQTATNTDQPKHTFGRHNGNAAMQPADNVTLPTVATETIMLPFDWLVHMDRPLVNQLELLQVRDTPSHLVTDYFVRRQSATALDYEGGYPRWLDNGFSRAFEYLSVRSRTWGVGFGGRIPGQVNINAIPDQRILTALLDPQPGNTFDAGFVNNTAWAQWMGSRGTMQTKRSVDGVTPVQMPVPNSVQNPLPPPEPLYVPAPSTTDTPTGGADRPFLSWGAPFAAPDVNAIAYGTGSNIDQTILRRNPTTTPNNPIPQPYLFTNSTNKAASVTWYPPAQPDGPSYYRAEPARKILNNITTVNHQYVVFVTVGYFDVVGETTILNSTPATTIPQLGPEAYIDIPGDMRQKFIAVVDMSNMALKPMFPDPLAPTDPNPHATDPPFFTSLEETAYANGPSTTAVLKIAHAEIDMTAGAVYVAADGERVQIIPEAPGVPGTKLVIGYGAEQQVVVVTVVTPPATPGGPAQVTVQTLSPGGALPAPAFRTAWGGTSVSNVRPGYPGPQPGFSYTDPKYKGVLPYVERLR